MRQFLNFNRPLYSPKLATLAVIFFLGIPATSFASASCRAVFHVSNAAEYVVQSVKAADAKTRPASNSVEVDFQRDADLVLFFHPKDAKSISEKGFLNQHESGKSSGFFGTALREQVENSIVGMQLDNFASKGLRPKSALVIGTDSLSGIVTGYNASSLYGGAGAVLKSNVKQQAIWTYGDSLQVGQEIIHGRVKPEDVPKLRGTFNRNWMAARETLPETRREPEFIEALIFGKLTLDNVDHFIVQYESSAAALMDFGKPIYLVTYDSSNGIQFKYKRILNFGETIPENLPRTQKEKILDSMKRYRGKHKSPKIGLYPS